MVTIADMHRTTHLSAANQRSARSMDEIYGVWPVIIDLEEKRIGFVRGEFSWCVIRYVRAIYAFLHVSRYDMGNVCDMARYANV